MSSFVLDASALLAMLRGEPGGEMVEEQLPECLVSAVNLAEVVSALSADAPRHEIERQLEPFGLRVIPFDREQAGIVGELRPATREHGLSLGDRACLALAIQRGVPALTADQRWADVRT